MQFATVVFI